MSIHTRAMQIYVAILDTGNFSEVARREGMSPSSVSRIVQQLEQALGQQLLYRNTRAIIPTEAGRLYGATFREVLESMGATAQSLRDRSSEPGGLLRINAPVVFGHKHIAPWLGQLHDRHPALKIELTQTDDFVDPLSAPVDLLFRIAPLQDSSLHVRVVDTSTYHLAASPGYLSRHGCPRTPADLLSHNSLVYKGVMGPQRSFFSKAGEKPEPLALSGSLLSNNAETLVNAALQDAGIVMMPDWLIGELLLQHRLVRLLPDYRVAAGPEQWAIAMLYPPTRFMPLNVRVVIDFFTEKFGSPPYWKYSGHDPSPVPGRRKQLPNGP
ncbi:LysR family transcriptional regulator [Frateuria aurantia]